MTVVLDDAHDVTVDPGHVAEGVALARRFPSRAKILAMGFGLVAHRLVRVRAVHLPR